eukprot:scaffold22102_cov39-Phaeocystis_antarctica.AAC.1
MRTRFFERQRRPHSRRSTQAQAAHGGWSAAHLAQSKEAGPACRAVAGRPASRGGGSRGRRRGRGSPSRWRDAP